MEENISIFNARPLSFDNSLCKSIESCWIVPLRSPCKNEFLYASIKNLLEPPECLRENIHIDRLYPIVPRISSHMGELRKSPFFILSFVDIFTCGIAGRYCQLSISDNHSKHLFCDGPKLVICLRCRIGQFHAHVGQDRKTLEVNYHQSFQTDNINFVIMVQSCKYQTQWYLLKWMVELSCYLSKFKRKKSSITKSHLLLTCFQSLLTSLQSTPTTIPASNHHSCLLINSLL